MGYKVGQVAKFQEFNLVVFGGLGDLAFRKIYVALFHRYIEGQLDLDFSIIAVDRREMSIDEFLKKLKEALKKWASESFTEDHFKNFSDRFQSIQTKDNSKAGFSDLKKSVLANPERQNVFYLSTPSSVFGPISASLQENGMINEHSKVVVEKPLGHDLQSSNEINDSILQAFDESQIYRIDHYLGKETVQNLMVLRFANNLFERAWDSENIDNIQITVAESIGVGSRAGYYNKSGALRDMIQNHLTQLLCLVAMEPPLSLDADSVRDEKLKVLKATRLFDEKSILTDSAKGQYTRGTINEEKVASYLEDIEKYDSKTETFVALKVYVDNWRWKNVPFYMRTGKRMKERYSDIVINFKPVKHNIFPDKQDMLNNQLIIRLQPEERIEIVQMTKIPGPGGYRYKPISLKLDYMDSFDERLPDAYERLIIDIIRGNQTLFMRHDELSAAWTWTESIMDNWEKVDAKNILYEAGSWGPGEQVMNEGDEWSNDRNEL